MDIQSLYENVIGVAENSHKVPAATNITHSLREELQKFAEKNRMTMSRALDMAIYFMLLENGVVFGEFKPKDKNIARFKRCTISDHPAFKADRCPVCGDDGILF